MFTGYGFVDWLTGSLDSKFWGYERYRVCFIHFVPYLKKTGTVIRNWARLPRNIN